jgi:phage shock protein PspC (stress-responsive transcriptional regulator)
MDEITKIHLGRQAFTMSVDAHKALQAYLHAISRQVGGNEDVVEEVELRMAELLTERGVAGDKVVLVQDVDYLKQQLGEPGDFGDPDAEKSEAVDEGSTSKRLFRDTEHGMVAGVAAGIGKYLGIDPLWVRLAFVALVFAGASGILLYIILWIIVPEAKTSSERLQMQGKPVTIDALKDVVDRADVKGAAERAQHVASKAVHSILKVILAVMGIGLMMGTIGVLLGLTTSSVYLALNPGVLAPVGVFPVGTAENVLVGLLLLALAMIALFLLVTGLSMVRRKWSLPGWGLAAMAAIFLTSVAVGAALVANAAPKMKQRYDATRHTVTRTVPEFHKLYLADNFEASVTYQQASAYSVQVKYRGDANFSDMGIKVSDQTLTLDSQAFTESLGCKKLCLFHDQWIEVTIKGPALQEVITQGQGSQLTINKMGNQNLTVRSNGGSVHIANVVADTVRAEKMLDDSWNLSLAGLYQGTEYEPQQITLSSRGATFVAQDINLKVDGQCLPGSPDQIFVSGSFKKLTFNDKAFTNASEAVALQNSTQPNAYNCLYIEGQYN